MARTPENLDSREITTTALTTLFTGIAGTVTAGLSLVITNNSALINTFTVYFNDGTTDRVLTSRKVAAGIGKSWIVDEVAGLKLNAGDSVKVKSSVTASYNTVLSGSKVT
jgi:hypothetical protein